MSLAKTGANEEISEAMPRAKEGEWDPIIRWWAGKAGWRNRTEMEMRDKQALIFVLGVRPVLDVIFQQFIFKLRFFQQLFHNISYG